MILIVGSLLCVIGIRRIGRIRARDLVVPYRDSAAATTVSYAAPAEPDRARSLRRRPSTSLTEMPLQEYAAPAMTNIAPVQRYSLPTTTHAAAAPIETWKELEATLEDVDDKLDVLNVYKKKLEDADATFQSDLEDVDDQLDDLNVSFQKW